MYANTNMQVLLICPPPPDLTVAMFQINDIEEDTVKLANIIFM